MNLRAVFHPYRRRLCLEGILKSLLWGLLWGLVALATVSVVFHCMIRESDWGLFAIIFGSVFFLTSLLFYFIKYRPNLKKTVHRLDEEARLEERLGTMVEFWGQESTLLQKQRTDALGRLSQMTPGILRFTVSKKHLISLLTVLCLTVTVLLIPYDVFAKPAEESADAEKAQWVSELLEDLREKANEIPEEQEVKSAVDEILDELEQSLKDAQSELEEAENLEEAMERLQELLDSAITRDEIGEALQRYTLTRPLGEAISAGDSQQVERAMEDLYTAVDKDAEQIATLAENIRSALADSGVDSADSLYSALFEFSTGLGMNTGANSEQLREDVDKAKAAILAALEEQAELEAYIQSIAENMDSALSEALGEETEEESPEGEEEAQEEKPEGEAPEGEMPEEMPDDTEKQEGEMPGGNSEGEEIKSSMTEPFYDPVSGSVEYGDVFYSYYYDYLKSIEDGEVSDDLQKIIDNYFDSLSQQENQQEETENGK